MDQKVYAWMKNHARDLELKHFEYLFLNGSREDVINELIKFQNDDGGFGHGIEPDNTNPNSSAIGSWQAISYIIELKLDEKHPMVKNLLDYLENSMDDNGYYQACIKSNNDYPHAIWWHFSDERAYWGYNPSVALWAFLYRYRPSHKIKKLIVVK